jgi:hypothetical protein
MRLVQYFWFDFMNWRTKENLNKGNTLSIQKTQTQSWEYKGRHINLFLFYEGDIHLTHFPVSLIFISFKEVFSVTLSFYLPET